MKWYWWVLIIIALIVIVYLVKYKKISTESRFSNLIKDVLNGDFGDAFNNHLLNDNIHNEDVKNYVQLLINKKFDLPSIKEIAKKKGIQVLDENETRTMQFNPRRVVVKISKPQCIKEPCIDIIEIISIG